MAGRLTRTEKEILRRVTAGQTSREIALDLQLRPRSVETYRSRMLRKLGVPNVAALVEHALRSGFSISQEYRKPMRSVARLESDRAAREESPSASAALS